MSNNMPEYSTFADSQECGNCNLYEQEVAQLRAETARLRAAISYLERDPPVAIGTQGSWGKRAFWVGATICGERRRVYGKTLLEAIEKGVKAEGKDDDTRELPS